MRKPKFKIGDIVKYNHGNTEYMIDGIRAYGENGLVYKLVSESKNPGIAGRSHWQVEEKLELVMSI